MNFKRIIEEILKFSSIGGLMTLFAIVSYWILLDILNLPLYPVYASVYIIAVIISYFLNAKFTFKEKTSIQNSLKYAGVYLFGLGVGMLCLKLIKSNIDIRDFIAVLLSIPPRVFLTFVLLKLVVFKKK